MTSLLCGKPTSRRWGGSSRGAAPITLPLRRFEGQFATGLAKAVTDGLHYNNYKTAAAGKTHDGRKCWAGRGPFRDLERLESQETKPQVALSRTCSAGRSSQRTSDQRPKRRNSMSAASFFQRLTNRQTT